jgi:hypothetical protein
VLPDCKSRSKKEKHLVLPSRDTSNGVIKRGKIVGFLAYREMAAPSPAARRDQFGIRYEIQPKSTAPYDTYIRDSPLDRRSLIRLAG